MVLQESQLLSDQQTTVNGLDRDQLQFTVSKIKYLQGSRCFNQPLNIVGNQTLRRNQYVYRHRVLAKQLFAFANVLWITDSGNFGGGSKQRECHLAGDHVDFIAVGDRYQHVRVFGTGSR